MQRVVPTAETAPGSLPRSPIRWRDGACLLILAALLLAFFWRYITPDPSARALFPEGDFIDHYYPWRYHASYELAQGRLPLWTPFANASHPFLADIQTAVLYPPHLTLALLLWLRGNPQLALAEMQWLSVLHLFLAGALTYFFIRQQTGHRLAGLTSALVFTFGSYLTTYPSVHMPLLAVVTWTPLVLLLVSLAVSQGKWLLWSSFHSPLEPKT